MNYRRIIAAMLAVLSLSGCVGVIFPIPASNAPANDDARTERR